MPHAPAVGAATIRPMAALHSATASALAQMRPSRLPPMVCPETAARISLAALPPVRRLTERRLGSRPFSAASRITLSASAMCAFNSSAVTAAESFFNCQARAALAMPVSCAASSSFSTDRSMITSCEGNGRRFTAGNPAAAPAAPAFPRRGAWRQKSVRPPLPAPFAAAVPR